MIGYVYLIENKINGKLYIGQSIGRLSRRWAVHCNINNGSNSIITKAINKYGKRSFKMSIIEKIENDSKEILIDKLNILEKSYILSYSSRVPYGYNILFGGNNAKKPDSVKLKISKSLKGNPKLKTQSGKKFTDDHKMKMSISSKWSKPVQCIETEIVYRSISDAAEKLSIPRTSLSRSLIKFGIYHGNLTLKYLRK